jgi:hypothetical protein
MTAAPGPDDLGDPCCCHFCGGSVGVTCLRDEQCDRLRDLYALQNLAADLSKQATDALRAAASRQRRVHAAHVRARRRDARRAAEEAAAQRVDAGCLRLAEASIALRAERDALVELRARRSRLEADNAAMQAIVAAAADAAASTAAPIRAQRWKAAASLFDMIPVDADVPPRHPRADAGTTSTTATTTAALGGSSTVMGLPLLNSGKYAYAGVPTELVASALSHAAHLVDALSAVLNLPLDHPLRPFEAYEAAVCPPWNRGARLPLTPAVRQVAEPPGGARGPHEVRWEPFAAAWRHAAAAAAEAKKDAPRRPPTSAAATTTTTSSSSGSEWATNDEFHVALALFRADIVALCMRAGVAAGALWPPEAILLNLHVLREHCRRQAAAAAAEQAEVATYRALPTLASTAQAAAAAASSSEYEASAAAAAAEVSLLGELVDRYRSLRFAAAAAWGDAPTPVVQPLAGAGGDGGWAFLDGT